MEPEEFIEEVVKKWMYHDIEEAIKGKANFLAALGLMAYTEIMGGLITGNLREKNQTHNNFKKSIEDLFPKEYEKYSDTLYKEVRCGLAHEYFVKANKNPTVTYFTNNLGIINNNPDDPKGEQDYGLSCAVNNDNNRITFHINQYFKDFKKAVEKYLKTVRDNDEIRDNFYKLFPKSTIHTPMVTRTSGEVITKSFMLDD